MAGQQDAVLSEQLHQIAYYSSLLQPRLKENLLQSMRER